jgi:hypothetical protein
MSVDPGDAPQKKIASGSLALWNVSKSWPKVANLNGRSCGCRSVCGTAAWGHRTSFFGDPRGRPMGTELTGTSFRPRSPSALWTQNRAFWSPRHPRHHRAKAGQDEIRILECRDGVPHQRTARSKQGTGKLQLHRLARPSGPAQGHR